MPAARKGYCILHYGLVRGKVSSCFVDATTAVRKGRNPLGVPCLRAVAFHSKMKAR